MKKRDKRFNEEEKIRQKGLRGRDRRKEGRGISKTREKEEKR